MIFFVHSQISMNALESALFHHGTTVMKVLNPFLEQNCEKVELFDVFRGDWSIFASSERRN